jgi:hypothetical protein
MLENSCKDWLGGIQILQFQKHLSYHSGIKRTPYKAMFGVEAKGLPAEHFPGFVGVSVSHERFCTLAINPLIEI